MAADLTDAMSKSDDFADKVASLCYLKYDRLPKTGKPLRDGEWTFLSAILLEDINEDTLQVVAIATGTKSIPTEHACKLGNQVIDNHAEVLARRCFLRFVYSEILKLANGDESSVFIHFGPSPYEYQLRPGLRFHFFSSHTPCGDASIFPKNDVSLETENEDIENGATTAKRQKLDLDSDDIYRTGAKCVPGVAQDEKRPGTGYHQLGVARSKPGRGAVSLSMSCSDKLAKWQYCGLEGALLSHFVKGNEPLRFSSVVVAGCPYNENAMRRALCDRLSPLEDAPPLEFHYSSQVFCHSRSQVVKNSAASAVPCASSIMWWLGSDRATHVGVNGYKQGTTRKKLAKPSSRLPVCRRELFRQFYRLLHELTYYTAPQSLRGIIVTTYSDFKKAAIAYQERKTDFHTRLPGWTTKSPELQNFIIREGS